MMFGPCRRCAATEAASTRHSTPPGTIVSGRKLASGVMQLVVLVLFMLTTPVFADVADPTPAATFSDTRDRKGGGLVIQYQSVER